MSYLKDPSMKSKFRIRPHSEMIGESGEEDDADDESEDEKENGI